METKTDWKEVIETAKASVGVEPRIGHVESIPFALVRGDERVDVLDDVLAARDKRADSPTRRKGKSTHTELASFIECVNRFQEKRSTIWADIDSLRLVAVFNYHPSGADPRKAGWCDHRAEYTAPRSPEWIAWTNAEGRSMSSEDFAEFIEQRMDDLTDGEGCVAPVGLLEVARNLQIHTKGVFLKKVNPETGEFHMIAKEEHDKETSTKIPRKFALALRVFEGGEQYRVEARIQFRCREGRAVFSYTLKRRAEIVRDAFQDVRDKVAAETKLTVFAGTPE